MSLNTERQSCVRCKAYLFSEDDVVYCPECGAPHHRDCYSALGHCALESLHGTEQQYSKEKEIEVAEEMAKRHNEERVKTESKTNAETTTVKCAMCNEEYPKELPHCPKCNTPNMARFGPMQQIDFLGGVPADYKLDDDVTADSAKRFVAINPQRYIPKFAELNPQNKISWNWAAFLFPSGWMLSRKLYKNGIITTLLTVMTTMLAYPLNVALSSIVLPDKATYADMFAAVYDKLPEIGIAAILLAMLSIVLDITIRVVSAIFADYSYKNYTIGTIKRIQLESEDMENDFRKKGGVNIYMLPLAFFAVQYLPLFITAFF